jgi:aryl-alcohol dehydrogenase-like predicted oxidoreductase
VLSKPFITAPIIGATRPHHLKIAIAGLGQLIPEEIQQLEAAYQVHPIIGFA